MDWSNLYVVSKICRKSKKNETGVIVLMKIKHGVDIRLLQMYWNGYSLLYRVHLMKNLRTKCIDGAPLIVSCISLRKQLLSSSNQLICLWIETDEDAAL